MKYSTSILATVVACAYMGQARTLGDQAKATQGAKEKTILTMDYDEDYSPYTTGYGVEDGYYFYPGLERERDFGYEVRERDYGYEVEEEDERPYVRYENRYPERDYGYGRDEESRFFRKDGGCGCEGKKHRHGCERGGRGYGYEENLFPYGEESREYHGGRYGSGYDVNDDDYEVRSYGGGYISRGEDDYEREGGRRSRGFVGEEQSFGYEEVEDDYSPYGEVDYEGGYRFSGYPRGKRQRGPIYFEHEREHERENRKEREERERKDFQKYKDIDAHKKEFEVEDDKRFLELGYGYDRGIKYNKGYGYTKSFSAEHEDRFDDSRFNREDAEHKDYKDAREFERYSHPREAEHRRYYEGGRPYGRHGRYFTA